MPGPISFPLVEPDLQISRLRVSPQISPKEEPRTPTAEDRATVAGVEIWGSCASRAADLNGGGPRYDCSVNSVVKSICEPIRVEYPASFS